MYFIQKTNIDSSLSSTLTVCCKPQVLYCLQVHRLLPSISSRSVRTSTLSSTFDLFFSISEISHISLRLSRSIRDHALHAIYLFCFISRTLSLYLQQSPTTITPKTRPSLGKPNNPFMSPTPTTNHMFVSSTAPGHPSYASSSWMKIPSVMSKDHST